MTFRSHFWLLDNWGKQEKYKRNIFSFLKVSHCFRIRAYIDILTCQRTWITTIIYYIIPKILKYNDDILRVWWNWFNCRGWKKSFLTKACTSTINKTQYNTSNYFTNKMQVYKTLLFFIIFFLPINYYILLGMSKINYNGDKC